MNMEATVDSNSVLGAVKIRSVVYFARYYDNDKMITNIPFVIHIYMSTVFAGMLPH